MLAFLSPYLTKLGIAAGVLVALLGAWLYVSHLRAENAAQAVSIAELQGVNAANAATIANMQADVKRYDAIEETTEQADTARQADVVAEHAKVNATPSVAISPVLASTLSMLRAKP